MKKMFCLNEFTDECAGGMGLQFVVGDWEDSGWTCFQIILLDYVLSVEGQH